MRSVYIRYLKQLLIFSAIIGGIALIMMFLIPGNYMSPALPFIFVFFISTSLLSFYYLIRSASKKFIRFVNTFLLIIIVKLFIYAGIMITYAFMNRADAIPFMLGFFVLYLCYTIFEASSFIRLSRPSGPEGNPE